MLYKTAFAVEMFETYHVHNGDLSGVTEDPEALIEKCVQDIIHGESFRYNSETRLRNALSGLSLLALKQQSINVQQAIDKIEKVFKQDIFSIEANEKGDLQEERLVVPQTIQQIKNLPKDLRCKEEVIRTRIYSYHIDFYSNTKIRGVCENSKLSLFDETIIACQRLEEEKKSELKEEMEKICKWQQIFISCEPSAEKWGPVRVRLFALIAEGVAEKHDVIEYLSLGFNWYSNLVLIAIRKEFSTVYRDQFLDYGMKEYKKVYKEGSRDDINIVLEEQEILVETIQREMNEQNKRR